MDRSLLPAEAAAFAFATASKCRLLRQVVSRLLRHALTNSFRPDRSDFLLLRLWVQSRYYEDQPGCILQT